MKIELIDGYYITEDNYNYILRREKKTKKGSRDDAIGYYGNLEQTVRGFLKQVYMGRTRDAHCDLIQYAALVNDVLEEATWEVKRYMKFMME